MGITEIQCKMGSKPGFAYQDTALEIIHPQYTNTAQREESETKINIGILSQLKLDKILVIRCKAGASTPC